MHDMEDRRWLRHAYTSLTREDEHGGAGGVLTSRKYVSGRILYRAEQSPHTIQ